MELYIDREELIQGLNHVQGIVERRSTNRILSNVLLAAKRTLERMRLVERRSTIP